MNQRGIFEKEIDNQVLSGTVDFAIHSMKDVPSQIDSELFIACVPIREAANDVLISTNGVTLDDIPSNSIIGTSSLRRAVQNFTQTPRRTSQAYTWKYRDTHRQSIWGLFCCGFGSGRNY